MARSCQIHAHPVLNPEFSFYQSGLPPRFKELIVSSYLNHSWRFIPICICSNVNATASAVTWTQHADLTFLAHTYAYIYLCLYELSIPSTTIHSIFIDNVLPGVEKLSNFFKPLSYLNNIKSCFEANNNSSSQWHKTLGGRRELLGLLNVLTGEILNDKDWTIWSSWLYLS